MEQPGILRLNPEIQFFPGNFFQLSQDSLQIDTLGLIIVFRRHAHHPGKLLQQDKILPHHVGDSRPLYLCDDPCPILQHAVMGLPDGSGTQRFISEFTVDFIDGLSGFLFDHFARKL